MAYFRKLFIWTVYGVTLVASSGMLQAQPEKRPYDQPLIRLSEILGSIHYLSALCGPLDNLTWRDAMQRLLEAEGQPASRKLLLTQSFNKGYHSFELTYRKCTPSALKVIKSYRAEGELISAKLLNQHQR